MALPDGEAVACAFDLQESHPGTDVIFLKCSEEKLLEGQAEKGKPFLINLQLVNGAIKDLE